MTLSLLGQTVHGSTLTTRRHLSYGTSSESCLLVPPENEHMLANVGLLLYLLAYIGDMIVLRSINMYNKTCLVI